MADAPLSKREYLEATCLLLSEIVQPSLLSSALQTAARRLGVPDASGVVAEVLKNSRAAVHDGGKQKGNRRKKEEGEDKRGPHWYNLYTVSFSDFAANYGHHPTIVALRKAHPDKKGLQLASQFLKSLKEDQKKALHDAYEELIDNLKGDVSAAQAPQANLANIQKFEAEQPEKSFAHICGLERRPEYKTDPSQVKAEAAEARKAHKEANGAPPATGTAHAPAPAKATLTAASPAVKPSGTTAEENGTKHKKKRRHEEGADGSSKKGKPGTEEKSKKDRSSKHGKDKDKEKKKKEEK